MVNGKEMNLDVKNGYAIISGSWKKGDAISWTIPMGNRLVVAHEKVMDKTGLMAVQHGPIIYCAEEIDNQSDVLLAELDKESEFATVFKPELLGGVNMLEGRELKLIPYYAWANRGEGKMNVWFEGAAALQ